MCFSLPNPSSWSQVLLSLFVYPPSLPQVLLSLFVYKTNPQVLSLFYSLPQVLSLFVWLPHVLYLFGSLPQVFSRIASPRPPRIGGKGVRDVMRGDGVAHLA